MTNEFDTDWFDLSKYNELKSFGLREWYWQILFRKTFFELLKNAEYEDVKSIFKHFKLVNCADPFERIKSNPILELENMDLSDERILRRRNITDFCVKVHNIADVNLKIYDQIDSLSFYSVYPMPDFERIENDFFKINTSKNQKIYYSELNQPDRPRTASLTIKVSASDEQILYDFKAWLDSYRKEFGIRHLQKKFTNKNLDEWFKWRLLPYLDLLLVSKITKTELTQNRIARLLFSDNYDVDIVDRLRRTTKPKAEWLISEETMQGLAETIMSENAQYRHSL
ncbi:DUF6387 family protein [Methylomonas sp. 2BW1-5-20]|uniref:DUF6387 family protein n=1 Tax=Methylomonas sp. 2BW1-5-20 TaxID=3376686 RepID=UPI004051BCBA